MTTATTTAIDTFAEVLKTSDRPMKVTTIGFDVYLEADDGRGVHAFARPTIGGMRLPALGVADYVYVPFRRGDPAKFKGARPMLSATFPVSDATLRVVRLGVRAHLADIDAGRVVA